MAKKQVTPLDEVEELDSTAQPEVKAEEPKKEKPEKKKTKEQEIQAKIDEVLRVGTSAPMNFKQVEQEAIKRAELLVARLKNPECRKHYTPKQIEHFRMELEAIRAKRWHPGMKVLKHQNVYKKLGYKVD